MSFKQLLKDRKIKQIKFADELGVSTQLVTNWVKGYSRPGYETVKKIAKLLDLKVEEVIDYFIQEKEG